MPRHRQKDFRSGDLCEAMGILLLKGIAAVAEVGRTEDVGIDAVATLLRSGPDKRLIAEDSFFVQIKSSSRRRLDYDESAVCWLKELKLPFFIASVDKKSSSIALYTTHRLAGFLIGRDNVSYRLQLHKTNTKSTHERIELYVGPPIATWSVSQLCDVAHLERVYRVIKAHIEVQQRNISYRHLRYFEAVLWSTNDPRLQKVMEVGKGPSDDEIKRILLSMSPHVMLMTEYCYTRRNVEGLDMLAQLIAFMKSQGIDPSLGKPLQQMRKAVLAQSADVKP